MHAFDVLVIGGGHAGTEAAHAAAKILAPRGGRVALCTLNPERVGFLSCNPAMGGLAKGQLIKEIDALGGIMGRNTDRTAIQYRKLNSSKGPAVRSSRAQCDKPLYAAEMQRFLAKVPSLSIVSLEVTDLVVESGALRGVILEDGTRVSAKAVVITTGTFLRAIMHTGEDRSEGGRVGDRASVGLSGAISSLGFRLRRLKTGTPPRLHKRSIDWSKTEPQPGDAHPAPFSFYYQEDRFPLLPQVNCFITYTNAQTHEIIGENLSRSPMYTGAITGIGPRYCPSIEDKVKRFNDKERHQIFLEPEGLNVDEIYVNGVSTSLPAEVQDQFIRTIPGLENVEFMKYGYAVEYDAVDARQLRATFESKDVQGLFFAGQINGTSGYEEAGAQGFIAGVNAARSVLGIDPWIIHRHEGYMGVLADDLVLKGSDEPYRMFTSRAEYRLLLREDNADLRLSEMGYRLGVLSEQDFRRFEAKREAIEKYRGLLASHPIMPQPTQGWFTERGLLPLKDRVSSENLLKRPEINWSDLVSLGFPGAEAGPEVAEQLEIQTKYAGYIQRDLDLLEGVRSNEDLKLPAALSFEEVPGLSIEIRQRLNEVRPETIGQASRLQGVTPAAVANLLIYMKMQDAR